MTVQSEILQEILVRFPYDPTADQLTLIRQLVSFIQREDQASLFLLKGYAGTGKTTVVSSLVKTLKKMAASPVLLAPTGRAAKVLASYAEEQALTIHKKIYRIHTGKDGISEVTLQANKHSNTIFIVDEASMIPAAPSGVNPGPWGSASLLDDLVRYVYAGRKCRLILIGDTAQLPPVGSNESPALAAAFLKNRYQLEVSSFEMTQVVRQTRDSGILMNATLVRNMLQKNQTGFPRFVTKSYNDFIRLHSDDIEEQIMESFDHRNLSDSIIICRSNKRANLFNENIRQRVLFMDSKINSGDLLMVVKNNYHWLPDDSAAGFIANGDMLSISRIRKEETLYDMEFADIHAGLIDYPDEPTLEVKVMLDTLRSDSASLNASESRKLFESISVEYDHINNHTTRLAQIRQNNYYQALQVKFGYALTCHKAQGGQWRDVFIDMGYIKGATPDREYLRWLYTALTRAIGRVFLLNFPDQFFE